MIFFILAVLFNVLTCKITEVAKEHEGLYYLSGVRSGQKVLSSTLLFHLESHSASEIWIYHKCRDRLHPCF